MLYGEFKRKAEKYRSFVIFGKAFVGDDVYEELTKAFPTASVVYCDNDPVKHDGKLVISPKEAYERYPDALFVLCSPHRYPIMREQLKEYGVDEDDTVHYIPVRSQARFDIERMQRKVAPMKKIQFEVHVAEHCNLNCKYCSHYSNIAEESFMDIGDYEKDVNRLSELFGGEADHIFLLGGEPLLNKEINEFMTISRKGFPETSLVVYTNGILLDQMPKSFYETCRRTNSTILITKYNINPEVYVRAEERCRAEGVSFDYAWGSEMYRFMNHYSLDLEGKQDPTEMFLHCDPANMCITLRDHKLYTCVVAANIEHFNHYFDKHLELTEDDGIDIFKAKSGQELLDFFARPIPFCRYCNVYKRTHGNEWGITNRTIDEWT